MERKVKVVPMPQTQADKIIGRVAQPLPRHYNGQGCAANGLQRLCTQRQSRMQNDNSRIVCFLLRACRLARASDYIPLSEDDFMNAFQQVWDAHVEFGTSRSHKKLLGKKRQRQASAEVSAVQDGDMVASVGERQPKLNAKRFREERRREEGLAQAGVKRGGSGSGGGGAPPPASAPAMERPEKAAPVARASASDSAPMANKGRFGGTLAARLLGGGGV